MNVKLIGKHEKDSRACRDGLALTLDEMMAQDKSICYVDCDLMGCINTKRLREHYPDVLVTGPETCRDFVLRHSDHGGADVVLEVAGTSDTFRLAWECARPNAVVTIVALYNGSQILPLPEMYGKNLTFKTGGVDGCDCGEILELISQGKLDTEPLITHTYPLKEIAAAYDLFENRRDGVMKVAIE